MVFACGCVMVRLAILAGDKSKERIQSRLKSFVCSTVDGPHRARQAATKRPSAGVPTHVKLRSIHKLEHVPPGADALSSQMQQLQALLFGGSAKSEERIQFGIKSFICNRYFEGSAGMETGRIRGLHPARRHFPPAFHYLIYSRQALVPFGAGFPCTLKTKYHGPGGKNR